MRPFAIAGLQLSISGRRSNLEHITDRIEMLMHLYPWVQMVVLSELATFGGWTGHAMPLPNEVENAYCTLAARHKIWLVPGSLYEKTDEGVYNTAPVINPAGEVIARYRKMFPFMPYETGVQSGVDFCVFDVPDAGRFGLSICYDMWFPETSRTLAVMGAEVIIHPTLTPSIDRDVELSIARATAATNQCFVVDINGVGDGGNGRSIFVAPTGDTLYEATGNEEMLPIEIDLERVQRTRESGSRAWASRSRASATGAWTSMCTDGTRAWTRTCVGSGRSRRWRAARARASQRTRRGRRTTAMATATASAPERRCLPACPRVCPIRRRNRIHDDDFSRTIHRQGRAQIQRAAAAHGHLERVAGARYVAQGVRSLGARRQGAPVARS